MSTVIARRFTSVPVRTAMQTWSSIVDLLAPDSDDPDRQELQSIAGVACSAISSEVLVNAPIVVWGGGLRVRIRCAFGDDAVTGDAVNEDELPRSALDGEWQMSIPCLSDDLAWMKKSLAAKSSRIWVRDHHDDVEDGPYDERDGAKPASEFRVNLAEYLKE